MRRCNSRILARYRPRLLWFDEHANSTRRRGWRLGWLRWKQDVPPYHYEWRWVQIHMLTWDSTPQIPAFKAQFEIKTYRTSGKRSINGSKRYLRFGVCL